jgi:DNA-binding transcriptional ArsR family regulator
MSVKMSSLVWEACLRPEQKYILLALADTADDNGYCVYRRGEEITISALAIKTGMSERTIQRQIAELLDQDTGLLELTKEAVHHSPRQYRIRGDKLASLNTIICGLRPTNCIDRN